MIATRNIRAFAWHNPGSGLDGWVKIHTVPVKQDKVSESRPCHMGRRLRFQRVSTSRVDPSR